jgi:hypothetical protein
LNKHYNNKILHNYLYLSIFESKYAVYFNERIASSIEKTLVITQYIFLRDITEDEYAQFLKETVMIGTHVAKKASENSNKRIVNIQLIKELVYGAKNSEDLKEYPNAISRYEKLLELLMYSIASNENSYNPNFNTTQSTSIRMGSLEKDYNTFFDCIEVNDNVYTMIKKIENITSSSNTSAVISRDSAIHEVHQGFTHLARHVNGSFHNDKELERFKSHIRRASLDLLKLSIESIFNLYVNLNQKELSQNLSIEFSSIKTNEVTGVVSAMMPNFKQKYTTLINNHIKKLENISNAI